MDLINTAEQLIIYSRYIGQQIMITSLLNNQITIGTLTGIKQNGIQINVDHVSRWIPLTDNFKVCEIKLLLKPLKKLTPAITAIANSLPVQAFITPYYQQLGFDMPVFIAPGHSCNCQYVHELGLADYRSPADILQQRALLLAFESA
ncbi:MAG: hypothetical protein AAGC65_01290 [Mucilaginibacter sp.]|uniref:hypothetical protein n=1 Tax=Mucilaginibacter sp. TaxID=1882438 RepID=UPI0031B4C3DC